MIRENKAIVGYDPGIPLDNTQKSLNAVHADLHEEPGFLRVLKKIKHLHAFLVLVAPDALDAFVASVEKRDNIEYCIKDYLLKVNSYQDIVSKEYIKTQKSPYNVRDIHKININENSGLGTKIALIDTGMNPHPYLPAVTFNENYKNREVWHKTVFNNSFVISTLKNIVNFEKAIHHASAADTKKIIKDIKNEITHAEEETWKDWLSLFYAGKQTINTPPIYQNPFGALRKLSPDSWNFIDDNFNIFDSYEHGTAMAGIIAGQAPFSNIETNQAKKIIYERYEPEVLGISPYSELVILKCYDNENQTESTLEKILDALEYCKEIKVDAIYIGLTFSTEIDPKLIKPLNDKIKYLKNIDVPVICPTGNIDEDPNDTDLDFPAADDDVLAISSINFDAQQIYWLSKFSKYATHQEDKVSFCAFGGENDESDGSCILSTNDNFGFSTTQGTSVSAAIATGIIASYKSKWYRETLSKNLTNMLSGSSPDYLTFKNGINTGTMPYKELIKILIKDAYKIFSHSGSPDHKYGYGLIKEPY